jgi:hypothetical protein
VYVIVVYGGFKKNISGYMHNRMQNPTINSVALIRERIIPTEWQPLVDEVTVTFLQIEGVVWSEQHIPKAVISDF